MQQHLIPTLNNFEWQKPVLGIINDPPINPSKGDRYIISEASSGDFATHPKEITWYSGDCWIFVLPTNGMLVYDLGIKQLRIYKNEWLQYPQKTTKQVEIDLGNIPISEGSFFIEDIDVLPTSIITSNLAYVQPTGKDLDELDMDNIDLKVGPTEGGIVIYIRGLEGYLSDKFKINYSIG